MKCKWGSCFILLIVIVITVFGIFEKRTYTNIAEDKSYLDELYVAQLPENICLEETENLSVNLPQVPVIIRVSVLGDVEQAGNWSKWKMFIREQSLRWDKIYILLAAVGHLVYIQSHIPSKEDLLI